MIRDNIAAVGGIIVFGSLMGAMFIGQQFLQNVLGYSTLEAGASIVFTDINEKGIERMKAAIPSAKY